MAIVTCWTYRRRWDGYFTYEDAHYFECIYRNVSAAVSYWERFWSVVATEFRSFDNLLGYELVNEPWAGNQYIDPTIMIPGIRKSEALHLLLTNKSIADAISVHLLKYSRCLVHQAFSCALEHRHRVASSRIR